MISIMDMETLERLKTLPVTETVDFTIDDRKFCIIDREFLIELVQKCGLKVEPKI